MDIASAGRRVTGTAGNGEVRTARRTLRKSLVALLFSIAVGAPLFGQAVVSIPSPPKTMDDVLALRESVGRTPEGGAALVLLATLTMKSNPSLGMQMMTVMLDRSLITTGSVYQGFAPAPSIMFHIDRMNRESRWNYLPGAYVVGTTPANGYAYSFPVSFAFTRNAYSGDESSGTVKVFVTTYGVMPRPLTMKVNDKGLWKAAEVSSVFVDVTPPPSTTSDDL